MIVGAGTGVLTNDMDPDGQPLSAVLLSVPSIGVLAFNGDGSFVYEPPAGFTGVVEFSYVATDGENMSGVVTVSIAVGEASCADCLTRLETAIAGRAQPADVV